MKLKTRQRKYLLEAAVLLAGTRMASCFVSPERLITWASRAPRRLNRFAQGEIAWVRWSIESIGDKPWMKASCLPRTLAAQTMLRRRGIASRLCFGVAGDGDDARPARAWIELGQDISVNGEKSPSRTRLVEFGGKHD